MTRSGAAALLALVGGADAAGAYDASLPAQPGRTETSRFEAAAPETATYTGTITRDGAWSWFSDPRALYLDGRIVACWVRSDGTLEVGEWSPTLDYAARAVLQGNLPPDDHNCPALLKTSDGHLTAFFSEHAEQSTHLTTRTTVHPSRIDEWQAASSIPTNTRGAGGVTYANPISLPGHEDHAYVFWRGGNWKPTYSIGKYSPKRRGWLWSEARTFIGATGGRPYVKYRPHGSGLVGVAFTDGHPRDTDNNIYFALVGPESLSARLKEEADRSPPHVPAAGVLSMEDAELVYDRLGGGPTEGDDCWVWDIAFKPDGAPVVVYSTFPSRVSHRYHWAARSDTGWCRHVLLEDAGGSIADTLLQHPQYFYSGGLALDPNDPRIVYVSRANRSGGWDIEQWTTRDDGETWEILPITSGATEDNVRPVVPWGCPEGTRAVVWMSGEYDFYESPRKASTRYGKAFRNFRTALRVWFRTASRPRDER